MGKIGLFLLFFICFSALAQDDDFDYGRIDSLTKQLNKARTEGDIQNEIKTLHELFQLNIQTLNHNQSYVFGVELEDLIEDHGDLPIVRKIKHQFYNRMGWLFNTFAEYETSIEYYQKAVAVAEEQNLVEFKYADLGAIAFSKFLLGQKEEAFSLLDQCLAEVKKINNNDLIAEINQRYYLLYIDSDPAKALNYARASLKTNKPRELSHRMVNMGTCFVRLKELDSALFYTITGLEIARDNSFFTQESNALIQLVSIYSEMGDYKGALENFRTYHRLQIDSKSFRSGMKLMAMNQEMLEEKFALQESLDQEKLSNQRRLISIFVIALLVLGVILFILFNRITLINQQKKIIEEEKNRAEQSERYVEQFLANLSHEIRTPMHAISGMVNALQRNPGSELKTEYLEAMRISSDNLLVLINDMLDLAKIESGKMKIVQEELEPLEVAITVVHLLKFKSSEKDLEIFVEAKDGFPDKMVSDSSRLTQILINLIGNAIKFTDSGFVRLKLSKVGEMARFEVQDTGLGIPKEKLQLIFNSFEQAESSGSKKYGGTGLGLSISKKLIEMQGGSIWVESEEGKGSVFSFDLPIHQELLGRIGTTQNPQIDVVSLGKELEGMSILLVDDDEFNIMVVKDDLSYFIPNVSITVANSGEQALEEFQIGKFDIVLMDIQMPGLGGMSATEQIRKIESSQDRLTRTPVIALTANVIQSEISKFLASGMDGYIPKPYKIEEILEVLKRFF